MCHKRYTDRMYSMSTSLSLPLGAMGTLDACTNPSEAASSFVTNSFGTNSVYFQVDHTLISVAAQHQRGKPRDKIYLLSDSVGSSTPLLQLAGRSPTNSRFEGD